MELGLVLVHPTVAHVLIYRQRVFSGSRLKAVSQRTGPSSAFGIAHLSEVAEQARQRGAVPVGNHTRAYR